MATLYTTDAVLAYLVQGKSTMKQTFYWCVAFLYEFPLKIGMTKERPASRKSTYVEHSPHCLEFWP